MTLLATNPTSIRLHSGKYFDLLNPQPNCFTFHDIANSLANICRFGGHIGSFYTVAEHCYHCSIVAEQDGLPDKVCAAVLLHDAAEAFIGDMTRPLKAIIPQYREIEARIEEMISWKYEVVLDHPVIKKIDNELLLAERNVLFSVDDGGVKWQEEDSVRRVSIKFKKWLPGDAMFRFFHRAKDLGVDVYL